MLAYRGISFKKGRKKGAPGLDEVPVWQVFLAILGIGRGGPMDQIQINIVDTEALERAIDRFRNTMVPGIMELGGDPDVAARNARILDSLADFGFIGVRKSAKRWVIVCQSSPSVTESAKCARELGEPPLTYRYDGSPSAERCARPRGPHSARTAMYPNRWRGSCHPCSK